LARERWQQRLRAVQIEERAETRNADRGATEALVHGWTRLMATGLSAKHGENASLRERSLGMLKCLIRRAGRINFGPIDRANIIGFLLASDLGVGIRRVRTAVSNARKPRYEIGDEEQPLKTSS